MVEITGTGDDEERKKNGESDSESGAASASSSVIRASSDGVARVSETESEEEAKRKKRGEGEADGSASTGTTFTRASGEGIAKLSVEKQKQVWADFRHLDLNEVVIAVAEFFSEFPARASANISVAWNTKGYAIVNMAIKFGQDVAMAVRERTRESAVQVKKRYGINLKFRQRGGVGASVAANPGAGLQ